MRAYSGVLLVLLSLSSQLCVTLAPQERHTCKCTLGVFENISSGGEIK